MLHLDRMPRISVLCVALALSACDDGGVDPMDSGSVRAGDGGRVGRADGGRDPLPGDASIADAAAREDGAVGEDAAVREDAGASSFVPYLAEDFESYADGTRLSGVVFGSAGRTTASAEQAARGERSARMAIASGDGGGFGRWGGIVSIDPPLEAGAEIWVRLDVYWPSGFEFSASPWMKFLRLHSRFESRENGGYNDLYIDQTDGPTSVLRTIKEIHNRWEVYDGAPIPRDRWERYEMYLSIDDRSVDEGGGGRVRIWRDGELIFDRTDVPTIPDAGGDIDAFYLFTYWNNERPPDNHCFVDDLVIATSASPPPGRDPDGHVFIGDWRP